MCAVNILVRLDFEADKADDLRRAFAEFRAKSLASEGNEYMYIMEDIDSPGLIFIIERWKSQRDFEEHIGGKYFLDFGEAVKGCNMVIKKIQPFMVQ